MKKTFLCIGDEKDYETFLKVKRNCKRNGKSTRFYKCINYKDLFSNNLPKVDTDELIIFLLFPFDYWDKHIETKRYKGVYGNQTFYEKFKAISLKIKKILEKEYKDKKIHYLIPPNKMYLDRDKEKTKEILQKNKVNVPKTIKSRDLRKIKALSQRKKIYIKVRYGSMGKGFTYMTKDKWMTNFRFKKGKILSKKSDYGWSFVNITKNDRFLKELLKKNITIEEEIPPFLIDNKKFDLRMYISFGKVRYIYPRTNNKKAIITNISQGGKGELQPFLQKIPKKLLNNAKKVAVKAAEAFDTKIAGVDIMFDGKTKKPIVIETNCFPGFPASKKFNLSKLILKDINSHKWQNAIENNTKKKIEIREATIEDLKLVFPLKIESKQDERKYNKELEPVKKVAEHYENYLIRDIKGEWRTVMIAIDKKTKKLVGLVIGKIFRSLKVTGYERRASISNLYVQPEYRKKGISKMLMNALLEWCKKKKVNALTLSVYPNKKIIENMYKKMGFKPHCKMMYRKL